MAASSGVVLLSQEWSEISTRIRLVTVAVAYGTRLCLCLITITFTIFSKNEFMKSILSSKPRVRPDNGLVDVRVLLQEAHQAVPHVWWVNVDVSMTSSSHFGIQFLIVIVVALHLYSTTCIVSEALLVNHLCSAPSRGPLRQCVLGFERDTLRPLPLPSCAGT